MIFCQTCRSVPGEVPHFRSRKVPPMATDPHVRLAGTIFAAVGVLAGLAGAFALIAVGQAPWGVCPLLVSAGFAYMLWRDFGERLGR